MFGIRKKYGKKKLNLQQIVELRRKQDSKVEEIRKREMEKYCEKTIEVNKSELYDNNREENNVTIQKSVEDVLKQFRISIEEYRKKYPVSKPKTVEEKLAAYGLTIEKVNEMKRIANKRNYYDGKYHCDRNAPLGSLDNPIRVGMEGCSETLFYDLENGRWGLTDGLGHGYIR